MLQPHRILFVLSGFVAIVCVIDFIGLTLRRHMASTEAALAAFYSILCIYYGSVLHSQDWTAGELPKIFCSIIPVLGGLMAIGFSLHGILARSRASLIGAAVFGILSICCLPAVQSRELLSSKEIEKLEALLAMLVFFSFLLTLSAFKGLNVLPSWVKWLSKELSIILVNEI
ncbi:uncharacterized protein LOC116120673 [Pistacia vera]|uniref:uncharacterized protein LOC116120673 n=1 Tax=Pistacia vera TaxID=55513 RepID=UPI001263B119|nr:uncharacterized protein LOC116120673 [Pistacia vera]